MLPWITHRTRYFSTVKQTFSVRFFLIITFISLMVSLVWMQLAETPNTLPSNESLVQEALKNAARDHRYAEVYRKTERLPTNLKYILFWTQYDFAPFYYFRNGQRGFIEKNCPIINCYVTTDKNFFGGDLTRFDAIGFNGRNIIKMSSNDLPSQRSLNQKYIYFNLESADNFPLCTDTYDNYFNWTATYRLDSDLPFPYIQVQNQSGDVVGPKINMKWEEILTVDENEAYRWQNKSKAVAWFVSHCSSRSGRKEYADALKKALKPFGLTVDIYGKCGPLECPRTNRKSCFAILQRDYYFYLAFENSFADDYVTEKLLTALQHDVVPIVLGGADYTRFLPPGSYLDASKVKAPELATIIHSIISSEELYSQFFRWKSLYKYRDPSTTDCVCAVCAALNNNTLFKTKTTYKDIRKWWNPNYRERCRT